MNEKTNEYTRDIIKKFEELTGQIMSEFEKELMKTYIKFHLTDIYFDGQISGIHKLSDSLNKDRKNERE